MVGSTLRPGLRGPRPIKPHSWEPPNGIPWTLALQRQVMADQEQREQWRAQHPEGDHGDHH